MENHTKRSNENYFWVIIIFLINPFLSLIISCRDYLSKYSKNLVWFFCGFYGFTFNPVRTTMDSYRHRADFMMWATERDLTFDSLTDKLYSDDVKYVDVFLPVLKFLVSRFTDNPNILYGILGLMFGYFFSRNIWFLIDYVKSPLTKYAALAIFIFIFIVPPWEINSFRFWMATHIFVYYCYKIFFQKSKLAYLGLLATPFIHFGYVFALVLFLIYKVVGNRLHVYFIIFVISVLVNQVNVSTVQNIIPKSSIASLDKKTTGYTDEQYIEDRAEGSQVLNWYAVLKLTPLKYLTIVLISFIYFRHRKDIIASPLLPLVCFSIFSFAVTHALTNSIPVFGRYNRMAMLLVYSFVFLLFMSKRDVTWYRKIYPFHLMAGLFFIIIDIRASFDTVTVDTLLSNPLISAFYQTHESVINVIK